MRTAILFLAALSLIPAARGEETSHFNITKQRSADKITVAKENGVTIFNISSSNGIGWAKIQNDKAWPMKAIVRLQYSSGRQWQHLENFTIASGRAFISTNLNGGLEVRPINDKGREALEGLSEQELAERVGVEFRVVDNYVETELPMQWLAEESEFTIRWIDLYRN